MSTADLSSKLRILRNHLQSAAKAAKNEPLDDAESSKDCLRQLDQFGHLVLEAINLGVCESPCNLGSIVP